MPTGYTANVQEGKVTEFKDFALQCARAFGACITQRDEDASVLPKEREVDNYYPQQIDRVQKEIEELNNTSDEELLKQEEQYILDECERIKNIIEEKHEESDRYYRMLEKVEAWIPPTKDHDHLKEFMITQLRESIDFDCNPDYYNADLTQLLIRGENKLSAEQIRNDKRNHLEEDLKYYQNKLYEEKKHVAAANEWIKDLYKSLDCHGTGK